MSDFWTKGIRLDRGSISLVQTKDTTAYYILRFQRLEPLAFSFFTCAKRGYIVLIKFSTNTILNLALFLTPQPSRNLQR